MAPSEGCEERFAEFDKKKCIVLLSRTAPLNKGGIDSANGADRVVEGRIRTGDEREVESSGDGITGMSKSETRSGSSRKKGEKREKKRKK